MDAGIKAGTDLLAANIGTLVGLSILSLIVFKVKKIG